MEIGHAACMYPPGMHRLSQWELAHCPWWIDFPKGQVLVRERDLYNTYASQKANEASKDKVEGSSRRDKKEKEKQEHPTKKGKEDTI